MSSGATEIGNGLTQVLSFVKILEFFGNPHFSLLYPFN